MRLLYGCDIPQNSIIADTVSFPHHALGVVIAPNTVIDDNVVIQHHVTLGMKRVNEVPHICRGAYIGAYTIILGSVTVGENAVIGAGSIVTKDVPSNTKYVNEVKDRYLK